MRPSEADGEFSTQLFLVLVTGFVPLTRDSAEVQCLTLKSCAKLISVMQTFGVRQLGVFHESVLHEKCYFEMSPLPLTHSVFRY